MAYTCGMSKPETFGQRLQRLRAEAGLTQAQLATRAEVATSSLQNWEIERREPGFRALFRLAKVLGVPAELLADTVPIKEAEPVQRRAGPTRRIEPADPAAKGKAAKRRKKAD
jgi:transcriptional regulator with XRE-family HTH domain